LLVLVGCQGTGQDQRAALTPLPEKGPPPSYAEVLTRARAQAEIANAAFYRNNWNEVQDAARALEQTASVMPKAWDVPPAQKASLADLSNQISKEAGILTAAAKSMDEKGVNECMTRINIAIRKMRLDQ
jgi:hypothetical protein